MKNKARKTAKVMKRKGNVERAEERERDKEKEKEVKKSKILRKEGLNTHVASR
jgi:hypothetical protein